MGEAHGRADHRGGCLPAGAGAQCRARPGSGGATISTVLPHIRSGKLKAVGIASPKRAAALPGVETVGEAGLGNFEAYDWYGLIAPAGTPRETVLRIAQDTERAMADPGVRSRLLELGAELEGGGPPRFAQFLRSETEKWGAVIREAGVKSD